MPPKNPKETHHICKINLNNLLSKAERWHKRVWYVECNIRNILERSFDRLYVTVSNVDLSGLRFAVKVNGLN